MFGVPTKKLFLKSSVGTTNKWHSSFLRHPLSPIIFVIISICHFPHTSFYSTLALDANLGKFVR